MAGTAPLSVVQGDATTPYTFTTVINNTGYMQETGALTLYGRPERPAFQWSRT